MSDLLNRVGRSAFSYLASGGGEAGGDDFVGSLVEVYMCPLSTVRISFLKNQNFRWTQCKFK